MTGHHRIDNGRLIVKLNSRGLLDVTVKETGRTLRNLHLLENRSDIAEGWNWRPAPYDNVIFGDNSLEQFGVLSDGPCCTVWKLTYALRLPVKAEASLKRRSKEEQIQRVTTTVTVPKGSELLYFETTLTNHTENNRLRVLFPTESAEDCFYTKTPFDFVNGMWPMKMIPIASNRIHLYIPLRESAGSARTMRRWLSTVKGFMKSK